MGIYRFPHMLDNFPSHANIGQQNLISTTPLSAFIYIYIYIYLLCFGKVFPLHYGLHDINTIFQPNLGSALLAQSHLLGDFITPSVDPQTQTLAMLPIVRFGVDVVRIFVSMGGQEQLKRPPRSFLPHNFYEGSAMAIEYPRTGITYQLSLYIQLAQLCQTREVQIKPRTYQDQAKTKV